MQVTNLHINALAHAVDVMRLLSTGHSVTPEGSSSDEAATSLMALAELMTILQSDSEPGAGDFSTVMTPAQLIDLRLKSVELGTKMAEAKGKAGHSVYIAADLYAFLMTGKKPVIPSREPSAKD